jgi:hypothetical protein
VRRQDAEVLSPAAPSTARPHRAVPPAGFAAPARAADPFAPTRSATAGPAAGTPANMRRAVLAAARRGPVPNRRPYRRGRSCGSVGAALTAAERWD